jgi:hypothetical protein
MRVALYDQYVFTTGMDGCLIIFEIKDKDGTCFSFTLVILTKRESCQEG